ncbi:MAG: GyrI-like domain-containing protein [Kandleria vitulina]|jgi:AraC family transcriptional regulator|uniref:GyrI-like domain-containing protein n=1 Tax=Kandleria vitulina TaxID=1630 RepID=UPI002E775AFA|nr:GyrI-like domain-containing protein [Kandleria vitulina]MEE0987886.1 GyrI-like domain-containing protein [Kandleria vitulina]
MDYQVKNHQHFHLIGIRIDVKVDLAFKEIPQFWNDFNKKMNSDPTFKEYVLNNEIGTYGVTINDEEDMNLIHYYIAGIKKSDSLYEGIEELHLEDSLWAHFPTKGSYPACLQTLNYKIYSEWFPHSDYTFHYDASIEYLPYGNRQKDDYQCELWIPVIKKN